MDHLNGPNRASSRVPSSEPSQPQRRGRKRKLKSDSLVEAENVQPSAKRRPNRRTPHDDASASAAPSVPASSSTTPGVGLSMPSIPSSGGSSLDGQSLPTAAHSDCTSDTQSSSECFSNAVEYDFCPLVSPASVSSNVLSPVDALGIPDDSASHQLHPHHLQHHQRHPNHHPIWIPNDLIPHGNRIPTSNSLAEKPSNANVTTASATGGLVEPCYFVYKQRSCPMPSLSWANSDVMWKYMCCKDDIGWLAREPDMFNDHPGLQPRMRAILLDWLNEVCEVYKMYRETYYLAVDYIDRYLSRKKDLQKTHLQLLGVTALFIAAKVEEIYPPKLRDFAYVTDGACTEEDILREELLLLCELDWNINPLTVIGWLGMYMQINVTMREPEGRQREVRVAKLPAKSVNDENVDIQSATSTTTTTTTTTTMIQSNNSITVEKPAEKASAGGETTKTDDAFVYPQFSAMEYAHTAQLIDLCSLDVGMANFKYSVIAAAAISHTFDGKTATLVSGLNWEDIAPCAKWMEPFFQVICEENASYPLTFPEQNEQIKTGHGLQLISPNLLTDLYYNKQTHTTSLTMLDMVVTKIEQMESTARIVQLEASPASLGNIESESGILTPPASTRKSLEMVLIATGGGGGSCQTQQHPPQHHQLQPQHRQLQPQEVTQLQPQEVTQIQPRSRRCHGVTFKEIALNSCREEPSTVSGIYLIQLEHSEKSFEVYCEQTSFGGGWIVIQHRSDGRENFYRGWADYRNGFGNQSGEFWLGLEHLHDITTRRPYELMVEVKDFHGNHGYANYKKFEVGYEDEGYHLEEMGDYSGTAGDSMWSNWGETFSTYDRDNDDWNDGNCAVDRQGTWWFYNCTNANLNGRYVNDIRLARYVLFANDDS